MEPRFNRNGGLTIIPLPGFEELAEKVKKLIEFDRGQESFVDVALPKFGHRASGEPYLKLSKDHIGGHDCVILTSGPGTYETLGQILLALGYLVGRRAGRISVVTGYLPLARSDKDEGTLELALVSHVVHLLETAAYGQLDRIIAVDLHSSQEVAVGARMGLITEVSMARRLLTMAAEEALQTEPKRPVALVFPDEGALKRFEIAAKETFNKLGRAFPVACGQKRRVNSKESKFLGLSGDVDSLKGARIISFDDEFATGKTNMQSAMAVKDQYGAAEFWAATVHGVLCGDAAKILREPAIDRLYITDTIQNFKKPEFAELIDGQKIRVMSWAADLAQIIYHHHWDISIRELR